MEMESDINKGIIRTIYYSMKSNLFATFFSQKPFTDPNKYIIII